jgi:sialic acid synthase SpsE
MKAFKIGRRKIGAGQPCYIIAEIGSNHDGSLRQAFRLIEMAARAGADAVKFQCLDYAEMHARRDPALERLFEKIHLKEAWYPKLKVCADRNHVDFFASPCYLRSIPLLERVGVPAYKIASPQTRCFPQIIEAAARTSKPLIISSGYCEEKHLARAVAACAKAGNPRYALLHCVSSYPTRPEDVNLAVMERLRAKFRCPVGFSDHTLDTHIAVAAAARSAAIIEKHITLDRGLPGPDHAFAVEPESFAAMVKAVRDVEKAIGTAPKRVLPSEAALARKLAYRLIAARALKKGEPLRGPFLYKRAPSGISAEEAAELRFARLSRDVKEGRVISRQDVRR